jgi:hypothetical protein
MMPRVLQVDGHRRNPGRSKMPLDQARRGRCQKQDGQFVRRPVNPFGREGSRRVGLPSLLRARQDSATSDDPPLRPLI